MKFNRQFFRDDYKMCHQQYGEHTYIQTRPDFSFLKQFLAFRFRLEVVTEYIEAILDQLLIT